MPSFLRGDGTRLANKRVKIGGQAIAKLLCLIFENHAPRTNGAAGLDLPVSKRTLQSSTVCTSPSTDLLMERENRAPQPCTRESGDPIRTLSLYEADRRGTEFRERLVLPGIRQID